MGWHARKGDPSTSQRSGRRFDEILPIYPGSGNDRALMPFPTADPVVFDPKIGAWLGGRTRQEIQEIVGGGLDGKESIRKRVSDLKLVRLIHDTGHARKNVRTLRDDCNICVITDRGRKARRCLDAGLPWYGLLSLLDHNDQMAGEWWAEIKRRRKTRSAETGEQSD